MHDLSSYLSVAATQANGTSPLPPMGDRVIAEEVAEQAQGLFRRVAGSSGFADSLNRLFQELRQAGLDPESFATAVNRLGGAFPQNTGKLTSLATLFDRLSNCAPVSTAPTICCAWPTPPGWTAPSCSSTASGTCLPCKCGCSNE